MSTENFEKQTMAFTYKEPKDIISEIADFRQLLKEANIKDYDIHIDIAYDSYGSSSIFYSVDIYTNSYNEIYNGLSPY